MSYATIGLDIGGTKIAGAAFADHGEKQAETSIPTPLTYEEFLGACRAVVAEMEKQVGEASSIGIGLPGAIDHAAGQVVSANLPFILNRPFLADIKSKLGREIKMANDANCMALAEAVDGAGKGHETVLGLIIGTGVGSGYVVKGQIVDGPNGLSGEVGHLPLPFREEADGPLTPCGCGQKGCIEKYIAGPALARLYGFMTGGPEKDAAQIAAEASAGDAAALRVLDHYYEIVAKAMIVPIHAFDPHVIVVSGGLNALPGLYEEVPKRWGKYCVVKNPKTRFVQASYGPKAGLRGAALLGQSPRR